MKEFPQEVGAYLQELKGAWADSTSLRKKILPDSLLNHPLRFSHPLSQALISPGQRPLRLEGLSMSELCQLALLRSPFDEGALARTLLPFHEFPTLWSYEDSYVPLETKHSIDLLLHAFGKKDSLPENPSPYFQALAKSASIKEGSVSELFLAKRLDFGTISSAFVSQGKGVSLGAMKSGQVEIPAFGPQLHPLNDSKLFGVDLVESSTWAFMSAEKEIWFEHTPLSSGKGFETRFFGLTPKKAVSFVFYIKAQIAKINDELFLPKTLKRFSKEADRITFEKQGSSLSITSTSICKVELIPLAGEGSFWDSDFLLAFEVPSFDGRLGFQFT